MTHNDIMAVVFEILNGNDKAIGQLNDMCADLDIEQRIEPVTVYTIMEWYNDVVEEDKTLEFVEYEFPCKLQANEFIAMYKDHWPNGPICMAAYSKKEIEDYIKEEKKFIGRIDNLSQ